MVEFYLQAIETDAAGAPTGRCSRRKVEWPVVPNVGDRVVPDPHGDAVVSDVWHTILSERPAIVVEFRVGPDDFPLVADNSEWEGPAAYASD